LLVRRQIPTEPSRGGPRKKDRLLRHIGIALMVAADCGRFGSKPTGRSARRRSGCSIIGEALEVIQLDERNLRINAEGVEKIHDRYGKYMPGPGWSGWRDLIS